MHTFLHAQLTEKEEKCIAATSKKFIATSLRATARLSEAQALEVRKEREGLEARLGELRGAAAAAAASSSSGGSGGAAPLQ